MSRYLYGASVQGIQEFIFKTNSLQEIVGASEIVKSVADEFDKMAKLEERDIWLNAAGNIKAVFSDEQTLRNVVREFPKQIMQTGYGITVSQAVVDMRKPEYNTQAKAIKELEKKLKIQRNRPSIPLDTSINILKLNPKTARAIWSESNEGLDIATQQKRDAYATWFKQQHMSEKDFKKSKEMAFISNGKRKIAVIHADGNGLGQLIPQINDIPKFSKGLEDATDAAFKRAKECVADSKIRKVILGGDDMTVICDANYALEFTQTFLAEFEEQTANIKQLKDAGTNKLTACAGIAYANEKYPFHYAISLAEALCSVTKKHAKKVDANLAPSSLMFHNIQSSNFQSWDKFVQDELTIQNDSKTLRCDFGPYYLDQEKQPKIKDFLNTVEAYRCEGSPISRLREWIGELHKSQTYADNLLDRINEMASQNSKWKSCVMELNLSQLYKGLANQKLVTPKDNAEKTPIYDVLQILSVTEAK